MSGTMVDPDSAAADTAADAVAMAIAADRGARARQSALAADYLRPVDHRLTDRQRHAVDVTIGDAVAETERLLRQRAQRMLAQDGFSGMAAWVGAAAPRRDPVLLATALPDLAGQMTIRAALADRAAALPIHGADDPDEPGFLAALCQSDDPRIAAAARALMLADPLDGGAGRPSAQVHTAIGWWLAGTIEHEQAAASLTDRLALRSALIRAAQAIGAPDDGPADMLSAADRLVAAIDPRPGEIEFLLVESARDRRLTLFCAVLARATGIPTERLLPVVATDADDRLWLALRAAGLDRNAMAMILAVLAATGPTPSLMIQEQALSRVAHLRPDMAMAIILPMRCPDIHARALAGER